jgi:hypothetical protein
MSYQNLNRLPIIEGPITTYTVERNVYGDDEEVAGWFIVERHAIHGVDILPVIYTDRTAALEELHQLLS